LLRAEDIEGKINVQAVNAQQSEPVAAAHLI
jgi:hypothetical protein